MIGLLEGVEREVRGEKVILRGLSFEEFYKIQEQKFNTESLFCYKIAEIGIVSFEFASQEGTLIKYNPAEHFGALFEQEYDFVRECAFIILYELTTITEEERDLIKSFAAFQYYLSDKEQAIRDTWDCKYCIERKFLRKRRCSRFDEETIEKIMKEDFKPVQVFGIEDKKKEESNNSSKETEEDIKARERVEATLAKRKAKYIRPKPYMPNQVSEPETIPTSQPVLKSPYYTWQVCPACRGSPSFQSQLGLVLLSVSQEIMLFDGNITAQPARFIQMKTAIESEYNHIKNTEERKAIKDSKSGGKGRSSPREKK